MKKSYADTVFRKILVPVIYGCECSSALATARAITGDGVILLAGIVWIPEGESLSTAAVPAKRVRRSMQSLADGERVRARERVHVSHRPWDDLCALIWKEEPDLLILEWPCQFEALKITLAEVLANPPCDVSVISGLKTESIQRILVALRGGPYAELALSVSLAIAHTTQAEVTSLHLTPPGPAPTRDAPFTGLDRVLDQLPSVRRHEMQAEDPAEVISAAARGFDLVVMGASKHPAVGPDSFGAAAEAVLARQTSGLMIVKTKRPMPANLESEEAGRTAISVLVDKWFAENTYHADEFTNLDALLAAKRRQKLTISLALPALNEEKTVGKVIQTLKEALMDRVPLLDELVLVDSDSTDQTREIAAGMGIPVHIHQQILARYGARKGKGEALWKSLHVTCGDIIIWIDTDIFNIHPRFVYGLIGPFLMQPEIQFVKGFYRRPLRMGDKVQAGGGGRVTELTARPLLNLFYPELSGVIQPLSGEYGGRREALEQLPFFSGYGVEIGLLIGMFEKFGLGSIAQVDLQERIHHNQELESLSKMSFAIIQAVIHKLERRYGRNILEEINKTMKLIRYEPGRFFLDLEEIAELERPPMVELAEYRESHRK